MMASVKNYLLIEENIPKFSKNTKTRKRNKIAKQNILEDKENISSNVQNNFTFDEITSSKHLKHLDKKEKKKKFTEENNKPLTESPKINEKYMEKLKEKQFKLELDKISKETERLSKEYEEKHSNIQLFDNSPQFQNMLTTVEKQLRYFLLESILFTIFSSILYFKITHRKSDLSITSLCLSISHLAISIVLISSLKLRLLNDPQISKAFRIFVIFGSLIYIINFCLNSVTIILCIDYIHKAKSLKLEIIIYGVFSIIALLFILTLKNYLNLFIESLLIMLGKKTEYSILLLFEKNNINRHQIESSLLNLIENNNQTIGNLLDDNKKQNEQIDEEKIRNYNYFQKFHYSVTTDRTKDTYFMKKKY